MPNHLIVVEGSHDAAFFGRLLRARGFAGVNKLDEVPEFWRPTIPRTFPVRKGDLLERIMPFPEIMVKKATGDTVGIDVAHSDSALLAAMRTALDLFEAHEFASLSLVLDTDWEFTEAQRFDALHALLGPWNASGVKDGRPGFPISFPAAPNTVIGGAPRVGIYLLPGQGAQGTLETILLTCAQHHHPDLHAQAAQLVAAADADVRFPRGATPDVLKGLRKPAGMSKAQCGIIGNVFNPGSSLSVSLRDAPWLPDDEAQFPAVQAAGAFLDELLGP